MRKILFFALLSGITHHLSAQTTFQIKGKSPVSSTSLKAMVEYNNTLEKRYVMDTVAIVNHQFEIKGTMGRPTIARIALLDAKGEEDGKEVMFYPQGNVTVDLSGDVAKVESESSDQKIWEEYLSSMQKTAKDFDGDEENHLNKIKNTVETHIKKNPDSYVSLDLFEIWFATNIIPEDFNRVFNELSPRLRSAPITKGWLEELEVASKFAVGKSAQDFSQNDVSGNPVSLSSFKGKYVLLDFWASWCGPCRALHPELVESFGKYKDQGFTIVGVSMDSNKKQWIDAIEKDGLSWTQLSDLKGSNNAVGLQYGITSIPRNFLIDPNGVIVGVNLKGKALDDKLAEIFN